MTDDNDSASEEYAVAYRDEDSEDDDEDDEAQANETAVYSDDEE